MPIHDILTFYIRDQFSQRILMILQFFYICTKFDNMYWGLRVEVPIYAYNIYTSSCVRTTDSL
jgi:hypothetical protein